MPSCGFDHVFVTVNKVRVNTSSSAGDNDAGWTDITMASPEDRPAHADQWRAGRPWPRPLPAGQYQQIRLVLAANQGNTPANSVVVTGTTTEQPLDTPSATQSGFKIIQPFTVQPNTLVDLVLDFNACKSIVQRGNGTFSLKPVVTAIPMVVSGSITGNVATAQAGAQVFAEQNGQVVRGTVADGNGQFVLSPLVQSSTNGTYDVVIVDNQVPTGHATGIIRSVPVTATQTTTISTAGAPFTLPTSATSTAAGTATPAAQASLRLADHRLGILRDHLHQREPGHRRLLAGTPCGGPAGGHVWHPSADHTAEHHRRGRQVLDSGNLRGGRHAEHRGECLFGQSIGHRLQLLVDPDRQSHVVIRTAGPANEKGPVHCNHS
jgi:hypothetical protein